MSWEPTVGAKWVSFEDSSEWETHSNHTYAQRELWYPLSTAVPWWTEEFHSLMLRDRLRMHAFRAAVDLAVRNIVVDRGAEIAAGAGAPRPIRIVDIGTGSGVLSVWACEVAKVALIRSGVADETTWTRYVRVYALDINLQIAKLAAAALHERGLLWSYVNRSSPVLLLPFDVHAFHDLFKAPPPWIASFDPGAFRRRSPGRLLIADLIVSETMGGLCDNEDGPAILADAMNLLGHDSTRLVPDELDLFLAPVAGVPATSGSGQGLSLHQQVQGVIIDGAKSIHSRFEAPNAAAPFDAYYDAVIPNSDLLADAQLVRRWELGTIVPHAAELDRYSYTLSFEVKATGEAQTLIGFKVGFKGILAAANKDSAEPSVLIDILGDDIEGRATSDCWKHTFLPIAEPIEVRNGDVVRVQYGRERVAQGTSDERLVYSWHGQVLRDGVSTGTFQQTASGSAARRFERRREAPSAFPWLEAPSSPRLLQQLSLSLRTRAVEPLARLKRTVEFLLNVGLGLVIGALFTHATKGRVISALGDELIPQRFVLAERLLMGVVALTLIRILHSFFLLYSDAEYERLVRGRAPASRQATQMFTQLVFVSASIWAVSSIRPELGASMPSKFPVLLLWGFGIFPLLGIWDLTAYLEFNAVPPELVRTHHQFVLRSAFKLWWFIDLFFICLAVFVLLVSFAIDDPRPEALMYVCAAFLGFALLADYFLNYEFYFPNDE